MRIASLPTPANTRLLAVLLFAVIQTGTALAQAWPRPQGEAYVKLAYGASTASEQYGFDGTVKQYADNVNDYAFFDRSLYGYAEYGITDNLTAILSVPFKRVIVRDALYRYATYGLGSTQLGARLGLKPILGIDDAPLDALSATVDLTLPSGYSRNYTPSVGPGQIDAEFMVSYGRSFYPIDAYAQASLGYRYRSSIYGLSTTVPCTEGGKDCFDDKQPTYGDEMEMAVETGYTFAHRLFTGITARTTWSLQAPTEGFSISNPIPTRQRVVKVGATAAFIPIDGASINAQVFVTPYGRNTVNSVDIFLGVDYKFSVLGSDE